MPIPEALPDIAIRYAVAQYTGTGDVTFGASQTTNKGDAYRAVLDYVNVDEVPLTFLIRKQVAYTAEALEKKKKTPKEMPPEWVRLSDPVGKDFEVLNYEVIMVPQEPNNCDSESSESIAECIRATINSSEEIVEKAKTENTAQYEIHTFPVYLGVGLRLTADFRALKNGVTLSGLGAIGVAAESEAIAGTLTVQTLGVSGKSIATALPLPAKLDQTTIEQSVLAIGTSRALLYNQSDRNLLQASPRVVGIYSPVGSDPKLINAIYSELSTTRVKWFRPCWPKETGKAGEAKGTPGENSTNE